MASVADHPPVPLLHRTPDWIAVDKPPGILVHRTPESRDRIALHQVLTHQLGVRLFGVHRLDRAASGVLLFATSGESARALHDAIAAPTAEKDYLVAARDHPAEEFTIDRPLTGRDGTPRPARTEFSVITRLGRHSLLRARIHTGRRHQIRRHLERAAHHVLGDTSHGKGRINEYLRQHYGMPRMCLHAWRLAFTDPADGTAVELRAPLADDLRAFYLAIPDVDTELIASL